MYKTNKLLSERIGLSIEHSLVKEFGSIRVKCPNCNEVGITDNSIPFRGKQIFTILRGKDDNHVEYQNVDGICFKCKGGFRISNGIVIKRKRNWIEVPTKQIHYLGSISSLFFIVSMIVLLVDREGNIQQKNEITTAMWVWIILFITFAIVYGFLCFYLEQLIELRPNTRKHDYKYQFYVKNKEEVDSSQQEEKMIRDELREKGEVIRGLEYSLFCNSSILDFSDLEEQLFENERELQYYIAENISKFSFLGKQIKLYPNGVEYYIKDVGRIDILARDCDGDFVIIETKVNKVPDKTVGQISRYMGWVEANLNTGNNKVHGLIVGHKITKKLKYAVSLHDDIHLLKYSIGIKLRNIK